jgi:uncharacterized zinc-type alcohol dehydrogenase-like protein
LGLKFAKALGAETTVFSHSDNKRDDAMRLGADHFVVMPEHADVATSVGPYDLIISTVSADVDLAPYLELLKLDGNLVLVGLSGKPNAIDTFQLVGQRRTLSGSCAGGVAELQEMMDFCAEHDITSDVEVVSASDIKSAYERTIASDVKYRFVIDASTF